MTSEMQKRLAALKAKKEAAERNEIDEKKEQPPAPNALPIKGIPVDEPRERVNQRMTGDGKASGVPDIVESPAKTIVEESDSKAGSKTTKKKVVPKPRALKKEGISKKEEAKADEPRIKLPVKRLNGHALADAIDAMTPEQIEDSGMGVLKAVLHRHAKRSISMMDAIIDVVTRMINQGYEF